MSADTASSYLDLHLEVARYFQRPETEKITRALKLLYAHTPQQGFLLLHMFPKSYFPFATLEQWNEYGRMVDEEATNGVAKFLDENGEEKIVYSVKNTTGEPLPDFPVNHPPPETDEKTFSKIYDWIDGMREADGIKLIVSPNLHGAGGYNKIHNTIVIPGATSKEFQLFSYMHSYIATFNQYNFQEMDKEEMDEYTAISNACIYKLFKDRGYDSGDYGLNSIVNSVETFDKYLELEEDIEHMLGYFEEEM